MVQKSSAKDTRLNLIVPLELKRRLIKTAVTQGKKVSALVRESIEEKLAMVERKQFEDKMREAYLEMGEENLDTVEEFKYVDAENL
jgi:predicted DNA-binding protein